MISRKRKRKLRNYLAVRKTSRTPAVETDNSLLIQLPAVAPVNSFQPSLLLLLPLLLLPLPLPLPLPANLNNCSVPTHQIVTLFYFHCPYVLLIFKSAATKLVAPWLLLAASDYHLSLLFLPLVLSGTFQVYVSTRHNSKGLPITWLLLLLLLLLPLLIQKISNCLLITIPHFLMAIENMDTILQAVQDILRYRFREWQI